MKDVDADEESIPTFAQPTYLRKGCDKICYPSESQADRARKFASTRRKGQNWKGRLHVYHCPECRSWHLGHRDDY